MGDIEFIFEPDPSGGGHGECITKDQVFIRLATIGDLEVAPALKTHLATLEENELVALELDELSEADVEPIRAFAETHGRAVFVRKA